MNSYVDAFKDLTPDEQAEINAIAAMLENQPESLDDDPFDGPPIPFMEFARLPFPIEAFPDWLYDMATATAITYQVPVDMAGMILLSVLAAAVSKRYRIQARQGWVELLGLYCLTLLETGNRKSSTLRELLAPIEDFERRLVEEKRGTFEMAKHERDILKARIEDLKKSYVKAKNGNSTANRKNQRSADSIKQELEALVNELAATPEPNLPTIITGDATEEKMIAIAAENDGFLAHFSAEGELFANAAGRHNSQVSQFEALLKGFSGDPIRQDRISRAPQFIPEPRFTVSATVQPIVIRELAQKPEFRHKGLLGRFLYSVPVSPLGHREINPNPIPEVVRSRYWNGIRRLLADSWLREQKAELCLSADANRLLADFERELEPKLAPEGELRPIVDWVAKLAGNIVRIAGILHMADHAGDRDKPLVVPGETMERALSFAPYLIGHAKIAYAAMETADNDEVAKANRVIAWIKRNDLREFSLPECHAALRGTFPRSEELRKILDLLAEHDWIAEKADTKKGVGRKRIVFIVNPLARFTSFTTNEPLPSKVVNVVKLVKQTTIKSEIEPLPFLSELGSELS